MGKLTQLAHLYCKRNYNLIELGSMGAEKPHIYPAFSPHGILILGDGVTVKFFVNNANEYVGLVGSVAT
ncbi:MAG TPA: BREX system Lon protease-like protein BrxL [Caldilineaceae bacterium]|nr:BREX system Lon protease-like protein BrxL [Caldilineaceae bacterium]